MHAMRFVKDFDKITSLNDFQAILWLFSADNNTFNTLVIRLCLA